MNSTAMLQGVGPSLAEIVGLVLDLALHKTWSSVVLLDILGLGPPDSNSLSLLSPLSLGSTR